MITAGEWTVSEITQDEILVEVVVDGRKQGTICGVWPWTDDARGRAEQIANAKAISKVPKLMELARRVAEAFNGHDAPIATDARAIIAEIENG